MAKFCKDCEYHNRMSAHLPNGQLTMVDACINPEYLNPVDASPMSCGSVRSNDLLCGIRAKGYKKLEVKEIPDPTSDNVILLK